MDGDDSTGTSGPLKRPREPFSDIEENVPSSEGKDEQKRRRVEASSQENWSPKPSSLGRSLEVEVKPDTPALPSVRQLIQRREGMPPLAQRYLSDPGYQVPSFSLLTGKEEFQASGSHQSVPRPTNNCPRNRSSLVCDIHQKLQSSLTPSSKQACRIRQEREEELRLLRSHPISDNAWLKRSSSDSSLPEVGISHFSPPFSWSDRRCKKRPWPPLQPSDEDRKAGNSQVNDGSFTEVPVPEQSPEGGADGGLEHTGEGRSSSAEMNPVSAPEAVLVKTDASLIHQQGAAETESLVPPVAGEIQGEMDACSDAEQKEAELVTSDTDHGDLVLHATEQAGETTYSEEQAGETTYSEEQAKETTYSEEQAEETTYSEEQAEETTCRGKQAGEVSSSKGQDNMMDEQEDMMEEQAEESTCSEEQAGEALSSEEQAEETGEPPNSEEQAEEIGEPPNSEEQTETGETPSSEEQAEETGEPPNSEEQTETGETPSSEEQAEETGEPPNSEEQTETGETPSSEEQAEETGEPPNSEEQTETGETPSSEEQAEETGEPPNSEEQTETGETPSSEEQAEETGEPPNSEEQTETGETPSSEEQAEETGEAPISEEQQRVEVQSGSRSVKKVGFVLEPELINASAEQFELDSSSSREDTMSELSSFEETNTAEVIDQMFEEVLEMAAESCEEDHNSSITASSGEKEGEEPLSNQEEEGEEEGQDEDTSGDELTFPPCGILSPLGKSVEAVVTPMRLAVSQLSNPASLLLTPEEQTTTPLDTAPLYSIDAYRTQSQSTKPDVVTVTPGLQRQSPEKSQTKPPINTKDRILALNEEAGKLQTVISQTLQALGCCTDEMHGRGSLEEAEAEKLLLVSCEKRTALLSEVARLKVSPPEESRAGSGDVDSITQVPCRGTVSISSVQLPLKVDFVCSARNRPGRPSHFFFVLIRYGACDVIATPLATAADAMNGDTISFPTSVTLKDIRSNFEIDVEVYSLSHSPGNACSVERSTKSRVTPRKLLNTFSKSSHNGPASGLPSRTARRSSNFSLVGSHKITLDSLGQNKFPLDKIKFEGKIRKLLGDEFQEKVPFLSPLEGSIYLRLDSEGHSNVQHQGFLTMFEVVSEFGAWHRRFFVLKGGLMSYWNHPNDQGSKAAEGSISLSSSSSQNVKPVNRDSCARPFTFELVSNIQSHQQEGHSSLAKCWFCADTRQERDAWMSKLNQVLLDIHTWSHSSRQTRNPGSSSSRIRESTL